MISHEPASDQRPDCRVTTLLTMKEECFETHRTNNLPPGIEIIHTSIAERRCVYCFPMRYSLQRSLQAHIVLLALLPFSCDEERKAAPRPIEAKPWPLAKDYTVMRGPESWKDLLEQLEINDIDYWVNIDGSIGFFGQDTSEVDRLANEAIGVYVSLQRDMSEYSSL